MRYRAPSAAAPATRQSFGAAHSPPGFEGDVSRDALTLAVAGCLLAYVWRIQDIFSILRVLQFSTLVALTALGLFVFDPDPRRSLQRSDHRLLRLMVGMFAAAVVSVPFSIYPGLSLRFLFEDFGKTFVVALVIAGSVRTLVDVERYCLALVLGALVHCLYIETNASVSGGRLAGGMLMYDANDLGTLLVSTLPIAVYFVARARVRWHRWLSLGSAAVYILIIIKSGSRGAFLGFLAVALYLLFGLQGVTKRTRFLAVAGAAGLLVLLAGDEYWKMMSTLLNPKDDYNWSGGAQGGRMEIWKRGFQYMLANPLTGVGAAAFAIAEGTISPLADRQNLGQGLKWSAAHNSFVQVAAELGVGGIVCMVGMLIVAFVGLRAPGRAATPASTPRQTDRVVLGQALGGSLVGFVVSGSFVSHGYSAFLFLTLGIILGFLKVGEAEASAPPPEALPAVRRVPIAAPRRGGPAPGTLRPGGLLPGGPAPPSFPTVLR